MLQRGFCLLLLLVTVAAFAGTVRALDQLTLDTHRAQWESWNISDYDLVETFGCFCPPDAVGLAFVEVRNDTIVSVIDAETHAPYGGGEFLTVNGMFHTLQFALDAGELWIDAQFDDRLGYPSYFRIDGPIGDDDYSYGILSLNVVPEPANIHLAAVALALVCWLRSSRPAAVVYPSRCA